MKRAIFLFVVCLVMLGNAQGAIVHRYAFDGDPNDSVGTADGVLVRNLDPQLPQSRYEDGQLILGNNGGQFSANNGGLSDGDYVDLPNGIISALGNEATFETWTTWIGPSGNDWQRIFDFGRSTGAEGYSTGGNGGQYYIFLTPRAGGGPLRFGYNPADAPEANVNTATLPMGIEQHIAVVWNGANGKVRMYLNGQLVDEGNLHMALSDIDDINNWLGRAQWPDTMYNGSYNEFRIYNKAMSGSEVAASLAAGVSASIPTVESPMDGAQEVGLLPTLEWAAGVLPADSVPGGYNVYLSEDQAAVDNTSAAALLVETENPSYTLAGDEILFTDATYYWRVVQIADPNTIAGGVVSFETIKTFAILSPPANAVGLLGKSAQITVQISSLTDVTGADWYVYVDGANDVLLTGDKYVGTFSNDEATLVIDDISETDAGEYYCVVTNNAGPKSSADVQTTTLTVSLGLIHRYSFTNDPNDSVGDADGVLINNTGDSRYENGRLVMGNWWQNSGNGDGDYVDLPNGTISAIGPQATLELWVTFYQDPWWMRVFDFGISDGGEDQSVGGGGSSFIFLTGRGAKGAVYFEYVSPDPREGRGIVDPVNRWVNFGQTSYYAIVWDEVAGKVRFYQDGELLGENDIHFSLADLPDVNNWLGRSQWQDVFFMGSYDEFRIWDTALSADSIQAHLQAGPDVPEPDDACLEQPDADVNGDCVVTLRDIAVIAEDWLGSGLASDLGREI